MKPKLLLFSLAAALLGACASVPSGRNAVVPDQALVTPQQAIFMAASAAPAGVEGVFVMRVQATGLQRDRTYLNSELDYRDQRNLTIAIAPIAARQLAERLGEHPSVALKGKDILVRGKAVRTTIRLIADGRVSDSTTTKRTSMLPILRRSTSGRGAVRRKQSGLQKESTLNGEHDLCR